MPTTTEAVENELLTASSKNYLTKNEAQHLKSLPRPVAKDAMSIGKQTVDGGYRWQVGFETEWHSEPQRIQPGSASYVNVLRTARPTLTPGYDDPACVIQPAFISRHDRIRNSGKGKLIDLANTRTMNVKKHKYEQLERVLLIGPNASGSHTGYLAWVGWNTFNGTDDATYGHVEENASGTNSIHNVSRSTYGATNYPLLHNLIFDGAGAAGTNLLNAVATCGARMQKRGMAMTPGFRWYATEAFLTNYNRANRGGLQYLTMQSGQNENATLAQNFLGKPIQVVNELPYQGSASATDKWSCVGVPWGAEATSVTFYQGEQMTMDPWETLSGSAGVQMAVFWTMGQLISKRPGDYVLFFDFETY